MVVVFEDIKDFLDGISATRDDPCARRDNSSSTYGVAYTVRVGAPRICGHQRILLAHASLLHR